MLSLLLGRIAALCTWMQRIVTDGVVWSVGRSVYQSVSLQVCWSVMIVSPGKTAEPIKIPFGLWTRVGPRNLVLDGSPDPHAKGQF